MRVRVVRWHGPRVRLCILREWSESLDVAVKCVMESFFDARDWEGEVEELRKELKKEKSACSETRRRLKSWEMEARQLRKE